MSAKPVLSSLKNDNTAYPSPSLPLIWQSRWGSLCLTVIIYFIVASVSLKILYQSDPTPIWPPAGFALVAALWWGFWGLGGIVLGEFIFNISQGNFAPIELLLTVAVVLQAMVGAYLLKRGTQGPLFTRPRDTLGPFLLSTFASSLINPTFSVGAKALQHALTGNAVFAQWITFWLGDSMGILLVTPLLLTLPQMGSILRDRRYELLLSLGLTGLVSGWILTAPSNATLHQFHSEYLTFSLTVWSALRFGLPGATAASFLISMLAILGVRAGVGPFVAFSQNFNNAVLSVQVFMTILMVTALVLAMSETQLRTTERQRTNLARYFSPQLVDELANQANPLGQDRRQTVAVLYADITGFTALLDSMQPEAALQILRDIHTRMEAKIFEHQGTLERYTGEGLIAVFGVPQPGIEDATYALNCAYAMVESLAVYNARRALNNEAPILLGIGIDYGVAVMGSVGTDRNRAFMVAGKVSKIPIHLKNLCTQYQADICLSKALQKAVKRENTAGQKRLEEFEFIGEHRLLGLSDPTSVFCLQSKTSDSYYREEATDI